MPLHTLSNAKPIIELLGIALVLTLKMLVYALVRGTPEITEGKFFIFTGDTAEYFESAENFLSGAGWKGNPHNPITYHPEGRIWGYPLLYLIVRIFVEDRQTVYNLLVLFQLVLTAFAYWYTGTTLAKLLRVRAPVKWLTILAFLLMPYYTEYFYCLCSESVFIPVSLLSLSLMLRFLYTMQPKFLIGATLLAGYAYWIRPSALLYGPVIFLITSLRLGHTCATSKQHAHLLKPFLLAIVLWSFFPLTWMFHVYHTTGKWTLSQTIMDLDTRTFSFRYNRKHVSPIRAYQACFNYDTIWACAYFWSAIELASLTGEQSVYWEGVQAHFVTWLLFPKWKVCGDSAQYPYLCYSEATTYPPIPTVARVFNREFPEQFVINFIDSVTHAIFDTTIPSSRRIHIIARGDSLLSLWKVQIVKKRPWILLWSRFKGTLQNLFPFSLKSYSPNQFKRTFMNIYYMLSQAYIWFLSTCFFIACLIILLKAKTLFLPKNLQNLKILMLLTTVLYSVCSFLPYAAILMFQFRYFHVAYYIFILIAIILLSNFLTKNQTKAYFSLPH